MELFQITGTVGDLAAFAFGLVLMTACIARLWKRSKTRHEQEEESDESF